MGWEINLMLGCNDHIVSIEKTLRFIPEATLDLCQPNKGLSDFYIKVKTWEEDKNYIPRPRDTNSVDYFTKEKEESPKKVLSSFYEGDTLIKADKYSEWLYSLPAQHVLEAIKADHAICPYRRYAMAIPLLEQFIEAFKQEDPRVILFGH